MSKTTIPLKQIQDIARRFKIDGKATGVAPHGSGHINDTYAVTA
jgi:hypothetical protein